MASLVTYTSSRDLNGVPNTQVADCETPLHILARQGYFKCSIDTSQIDVIKSDADKRYSATS